MKYLPPRRRQPPPLDPRKYPSSSERLAQERELYMRNWNHDFAKRPDMMPPWYTDEDGTKHGQVRYPHYYFNNSIMEDENSFLRYLLNGKGRDI